MRTFGNIIWHFPFLGFVNSIFAFILGSLFVLTVAGAPIGMGLLQLSRFFLAPFSYQMVDGGELRQQKNQALAIWNTVVMLVWLPFGILLTLITVIQVGFLFLSIIGIPAGIAIGKTLGTVFNPVNKKCVSWHVGEELQRRKAAMAVEAALGSGEATAAARETI